jgi:hypothetical protein
MKRVSILCGVASLLLLTTASPLLADSPETAPERDWLAAPPPAAGTDEPTPRDPRFELFPGAEDIGVPDENGISPELREEIRRHSERVLNQVSDELSTL